MPVNLAGVPLEWHSGALRVRGTEQLVSLGFTGIAPNTITAVIQISPDGRDYVDYDGSPRVLGVAAGAVSWSFVAPVGAWIRLRVSRAAAGNGNITHIRLLNS